MQLRYEFDFRHEAAAMDSIGDSLRRQWQRPSRGRHHHRGGRKGGSAADDMERVDQDSAAGVVVPRSIPGLVTR